MLRTAGPNISIITNWGCRSDCWYCIWKGHPLEFVNEPTDWKKLEKFISGHKDLGKISISGGGDCLYKYQQHIAWWNKIYKLAVKYGMRIDIHTREKYYDAAFFKKHINKCVFSSDNPDEDFAYLEWLSKLCKLRIVHVVTKHTTERVIDKFMAIQDYLGCQFTIKQLSKYDDGGMYKQIKEAFPSLYCLDEGDYNIYYMPDNTISEKFI